MLLMEKDEIRSKIKNIVNQSSEPLETKEIQEKMKKSIGDISRSKLMYRLNNLRGEGQIYGKYVGSGKGVWIWWKSGHPKKF